MQGFAFGPVAFAVGLEIATGVPTLASDLLAGGGHPPPDSVHRKKPQWSAVTVCRAFAEAGVAQDEADRAFGAAFRAQCAAENLYLAGREVSDAAVRAHMVVMQGLTTQRTACAGSNIRGGVWGIK